MQQSLVSWGGQQSCPGLLPSLCLNSLFLPLVWQPEKVLGARFRSCCRRGCPWFLVSCSLHHHLIGNAEFSSKSCSWCPLLHLSRERLWFTFEPFGSGRCWEGPRRLQGGLAPFASCPGCSEHGALARRGDPLRAGGAGDRSPGVASAEPLGQGSPGWGRDGGILGEQRDAGGVQQRVNNEVQREGKKNLIGAPLST